ncbi:MAG TPA: hypothetical protein PLY35_08915 [Thermotogota bacterium]|nr:hypothetical protein [Thermotogota bacterium]
MNKQFYKTDFYEGVQFTKNTVNEAANFIGPYGYKIFKDENDNYFFNGMIVKINEGDYFLKNNYNNIILISEELLTKKYTEIVESSNG